MKPKFTYRFIIFFIINLVILICLLTIIKVNAATTTEAITSTVETGKNNLIVESMKKVYEISQNSLTSGYSADLNLKDGFRIFILQRPYYLLFWNSTDTDAGILISDGKFGNLIINHTKVVDVDDNGKYDLFLTLQSLNSTTANVKIQEYRENVYKSEYQHLELFDVNLDLKKDKIINPRDLQAYINFVNFGNGPSHINIIYSIKNSSGQEVYRGIDEKVVYTQDSLVKSFDFLDIPLGKYTLSADIFYGNNQTARSERSFEIIENNNYLQNFKILAFFVLVLLIAFSLYLIRKTYKSSEAKR